MEFSARYKLDCHELYILPIFLMGDFVIFCVALQTLSKQYIGKYSGVQITPQAAAIMDRTLGNGTADAANSFFNKTISEINSTISF